MSLLSVSLKSLWSRRNGTGVVGGTATASGSGSLAPSSSAVSGDGILASGISDTGDSGGGTQK